MEITSAQRAVYNDYLETKKIGPMHVCGSDIYFSLWDSSRHFICLVTILPNGAVLTEN